MIDINNANAMPAPERIETDPDGLPRWARPEWLVQATTERGERYVHTAGPMDRDSADQLAARVLDAGRINPDHWYVSFPVYGSRAYAEDCGEEDAMAFEREAEQFPTRVPLLLQ